MKVRRLREEKALSQRELARLAGLTHMTLWRVENGYENVHPKTVRKLSGVLGVEPVELFKIKEE